jgi:hypothetical protein
MMHKEFDWFVKAGRVVGIALGVCIVLRLVLGMIYKTEMMPQSFPEPEITRTQFSEKNGFFKLLHISALLSEPLDKARLAEKYRKLSLSIQTNHSQRDLAEQNERIQWQSAAEVETLSKKLIFMENTDDPQIWISTLDLLKPEILSWETSNQVIIDRYQSFTQSEVIEDILGPKINIRLSVLDIARLGRKYASLQIIKALEYEWEGAVNRLSDQLQAMKKLAATAQSTLSQLIAWSGIKYSLSSLFIVASQADCPREISRLILKKIQPPLDFHPLLCGKNIFNEYQQSLAWILENKECFSDYLPILGKGAGLLLDKNDTKQLLYDNYKKIVDFKGDIPFTQISPCLGLELLAKKDFSWRYFFNLLFNNEAGKIMVDSCVPYYCAYNNHLVKKIYYLVLLQRMLRSQCHKNLNEPFSAEDNGQPADGQGNIDPFTGQEFKFDDQKNIFYSSFLREEAKRDAERLKEKQHPLKSEGSHKTRRRRQ